MIDVSEVMGFSQKQKDAMAGSTGRVNIWDGSVRSGKTYTWAILMLSLVAAYTGSAAIVITGKNRDSIYRNVFEPIETLTLFIPVKKYVVYRQGAPRATIFGKQVHIIGANDAGAESKIRGMTIGLAFADEITLLHPAFFKQLLSRLSKSYSKLFCTTNPDSQNHWLRKEYLTRIPDCMHFDQHTSPEDELSDWTYWHFTMEDNPSLTEGYKTNLRKEYTGMWYRRFILGLWVAAEGAIYQMWDEDRHVIRPDDMPPMKRTLALGIDYGTTHPTVGILLGLGEDNRLYALDEWLPGRLTDKALSESLKEFRDSHSQPEWVYVDPAAASFSLQLHEDGHRRVDKANNDVLDGIRTVASLLDNDQLFVSSTCTKLIEELPGYRWDEKAAEKGIDKPIKEIDDAADALRYSVYSSRYMWSRFIQS
jgi:PBSX family phage terminase large subunit